MSDNEQKMKWFVIQTSSGYEARVQKTLIEQIKRSSCPEKFGDVIIPTEEVTEVKNGVKRKSERKFFPGYVLVHMVMDDDSWHLVKDTNHVQGFLGCSKDKPVPLTDAEAKKLLDAMNKDIMKLASRSEFAMVHLKSIQDQLKKLIMKNLLLLLQYLFLDVQLPLNWNFLRLRKSNFNLLI